MLWIVSLFAVYLSVYQVYCFIKPPYIYKEKWFHDLPVDHFAFSDNRTFSMRYLINDTFYKRGMYSGPIFFYCGNEGDVTLFAQNAGFMWDIAPQFNALLLFAEHRFYGKTLPFGNESYANLDNLGKLSTEQALADYAIFLRWFKNVTYAKAKNAPVVAFGGSYGGTLAAWLRIKYPHVVVGSLASSAPILQFQGVTDCSVYSSIVTRTFRNSGPNCDQTIKASYPIIRDMASTVNGQNWLDTNFVLCNDSFIRTFNDAWNFVFWLYAAYGNLAMMDYPYATNFTNPVPAWPVKVACSYLTDPKADNLTLLLGVYKAVSVYMNYTGQTACYSFSSTTSSEINLEAWDFQTCTEMVMPMCNNGVTDMFEPFPWNYKAFSDQCLLQRGVRPREYWATTEYGADKLGAASNIIFSNGDLDPWSGGGVTKNITGAESLVPIYIQQAAHHYDLRGYDERDTRQVLSAREREIRIISGWLGLKKTTEKIMAGYLKPT